MKISYSSFKRYIDCPRKYKWTLDRVDPPEPSSKYFALYGLLVQKFFEHLCNNHYRNNPNLTPAQVKLLMKQQWRFILEDNYVDWHEPWCRQSSEDIFDESLEDVLKNMETLNFFRNTKSEVVYETQLKKSKDLITGRVDFVYINDQNQVEILDGKGTNKIETNVDTDQLYFYALLYLLKHRRLPHKLGFVFYKFQTTQYVDFNLDTIMEFKNKLALVKRAIKTDTTWEPKVKLSKQCKWCDYRYMCDAYGKQKDANAAKRKSKIVAPKTGGVIDL
jgi:CRISPR/Cas system-associated exonuclease Cas4 (RecB family)